MLDFLTEHLATVLAIVTAVSGALVGVASFVKAIAVSKQTAKEIKEMRGDVTITREGVVKAFQDARIDTNWKVDVSGKIDKTCEKWFKQMQQDFAFACEKLKDFSKLQTELALSNAKILAFTAAYDKLKPEEKEQLQKLLGDVTNAVVEVK